MVLNPSLKPEMGLISKQGPTIVLPSLRLAHSKLQATQSSDQALDVAMIWTGNEISQ